MIPGHRVKLMAATNAQERPWRKAIDHSDLTFERTVGRRKRLPHNGREPLRHVEWAAAAIR
jgi:hypothetical protein